MPYLYSGVPYRYALLPPSLMLGEDFLTLWCVVDGDPAPLKIPVHRDADIADLKKAIKGEKVLNHVSASNLVLWKLTELEPVEPEDTLVQRIRSRGDVATFAKRLTATQEVSALFPQHPPEDHVHLLVQLPSTSSRLRFEPPRDITMELLSRWSKLTMTLPTSSAKLREYLNKPLEESEKVPLSRDAMVQLLSRGDPNIMCSESDLELIFRCSEEEASDYLFTILKTAIVTSAPDSDGTEASFISFWDDNIRKIVAATLVPNKVIRDSNRNTSIALQRPDIGFLHYGVCTFRGEEKPSRYSGMHPREELLKKLNWTYHPAPYILGYHAVGAEVTLAAIYPSVVVDLNVLDLSYKTQRIHNILRMIKLASLLRLLQQIIGPRDLSEFVPIERETGTIIELGHSYITKAYGFDGSSRVLHLRHIYRILHENGVPNVDRLMNSFTDHKRHGAVVYLQPKGINRAPTSRREVEQAVLSVLEALVVLHRGPNPVFHRDIRWPNVILSSNDFTNWFLIDWDDASTLPTRAATHLDPYSHPPAVFVDNHRGEVDVWGVGKLILDASVPDISDTMMASARAMVEGQIKTASEALAHIRASIAAVR